MDPRSFVTNLVSGSSVKAATSVTFRGIAFGGDCGVAKVDVSIDHGETWRQIQLGENESKYGFCRWETQLTFPMPGEYSFRVRCTNSNGVPQPDRPNWNPAGFMRNMVEAISVVAI